MDDYGGLYIGRLMVLDGTKNCHKENCLGFGTSVGLGEDITVESRGPGRMITCVEHCMGDSMYTFVDSVL